MIGNYDADGGSDFYSVASSPDTTDVENRYTDDDGPTDEQRGTQGGRVNRQVATSIAEGLPIPTGSTWVSTDVGGDDTEGGGGVREYADNVFDGSDGSTTPDGSGSSGSLDGVDVVPGIGAGGSGFGAVAVAVVLAVVGIVAAVLSGGDD